VLPSWVGVLEKAFTDQRLEAILSRQEAVGRILQNKNGDLFTLTKQQGVQKPFHYTVWMLLWL